MKPIKSLTQSVCEGEHIWFTYSGALLQLLPLLLVSSPVIVWKDGGGFRSVQIKTSLSAAHASARLNFNAPSQTIPREKPWQCLAELTLWDLCCVNCVFRAASLMHWGVFGRSKRVSSQVSVILYSTVHLGSFFHLFSCFIIQNHVSDHFTMSCMTIHYTQMFEGVMTSVGCNQLPSN